MKRLFLFLILLNSAASFAGNFTAGNLVVLRVGSGSALLTNGAHPVFLDEYTRAGVLVQSIPLPTATSGSNHPFSLSGTATSEGTLTLSANGQYLVVAGYDATPGTAAVVGDSTLNRVVARIGTNGVPNTSTGILAGAAYTQDNIRAATSADGTKFWLAGNGTNDRGGTYYLPFGSFTNSPVKISTPPNNTRTVSIFNNQLYISSQTNTYNGVSIVGNGLPTTSGHATTLFPGFAVPSSFSVFSFWLFDMNPNVPGMDVLYFCDDRDVAPNGGIYKYSLVNGTWVSNGNLTVPNNIKGITAERTCYTQIYCSSGTRVFSLRDDNGYNQPMTGTLVQIAMAATNTKFRGIAFAPGTSTLSALQPSVAATNVSCFNAANGAINLTVNGGVSPYTYSWNDGISTKNRSNIAPGTYLVTVTDANNCTANASATITQPTQLNVSASKTDVSCNGGSNGSVTLTVSGGTANYTFTWNGGSTSQNRSNLSAGTYSVTVTDNKGCTATTSVSIAQPAALSASTSKTNVACNGGNNGSVTLTVNGGTTPYTYRWSNNATSQNLSGLSAGTYTVTITDARNCTASASASITQPPGMNLSTAVTHVKCNGGNDGSIDLTVSGGSAPYTYNWSGGSGAQDISNLGAGTYSVTVQDASSCSATIAGIAVTQPSALVASLTKTNVRCNRENNGSVDLTVSGGTAPYGYLWSSTATTQDIGSLGAGIYNVTITDAQHCSVTNGATITQPAALAVSLTKTNVSCNGGSNGSIDLTVSGGVSDYTYLWSNSATTQDLSNVGAAAYNLTVTDANSCTASGGAAITEPAAITTSLTKTDVSCNGGSNGVIDLSVSGGVSPFTYLWSNQAATQDLNNLVAATYSVVITDANSCTATDGAVITQPALLTASLSKTDVLCNGGTTGSVALTVNGGTLPYLFNWSNNAATQNIAGLAAGSYGVTVTDGKNCIATGAATVTEPSAITINQIVTDASCNGGADGEINISVSGGVAGYNFLWSSGSTSEDLSGVSAGLYQLTVEDANECVQYKSITIGESSALAVTLISKSDLTCTGGINGSINIEAAGGVLPYTFVWSNGFSTEDISALDAGNYTVTVSDANNCSKVENYVIAPAPVITANAVRANASCFGGGDGSIDLSVSGGTAPYQYLWSNGNTTEDISDLVTGVYTVTINDINGCNALAGTIITSPSAITTTLAKNNVTCFGGNNGGIDLAVSGGTAPYAYNWSDSTTLQDAGSLIAGVYSVTITDAKGCIAIDGEVITEPAELIATLNPVNVSCKNGSDASIDLEVSGGVAPYAYDWSNGVTLEDNATLAAGNYAVTVQDANGCITSASATITEPDVLTVSAAQTDAGCFAGADGAVTLTVSGGTLDYDFTWSNGDSMQNISGLTAGNYAVTVTDNNGCIAVEGVTLTQPTEINIIADVSNPLCSGGNTGAIDITVTGGTPGYAFEWSNAATNEDLTAIAAGNYVVTVTDGNGCSKSFSADLTQAGTLQVELTATQISCNRLNNGALNLSVIGGTPAYRFSWSNADTTQNISGLAAGIFSVTVSDANGCSIATTDTITEPAAIGVVINVSDITCFGAANGSALLSVSGGKAPYIYNWANGGTGAEITGLVAGNYPVTITDDNACTATASADVAEPDSMHVEAGIRHATLFGSSDGAIQLDVEGGTGTLAFSWSNSESAEDLNNVVAGDYCVTITDANFCTINKCFTVNQPPNAVDEQELVSAFHVSMQHGSMVIKAKLREPLSGQLQVFDITGRVLAVHDFKEANVIHEALSFDAAAGCYFVHFLTQKGAYSSKVVATR